MPPRLSLCCPSRPAMTEPPDHPHLSAATVVGDGVLVRGGGAAVDTADVARFSHPLAFVRHVNGWSYQGLVDSIARQAAAMPKIGNMAARREKAWRWEHWGVIPDRD